VIVAGCIIGTFLEESGGAYSMAEWILRIVGEKRAALVMSIIGFFVSIPVFADSGFVVLTPLNKALAKRAKLSMAAAAIALAVGLATTHVLVPPTPGPIAAAGILHADIGLVILLALIVSPFALVVGYLYAIKYAARTYIDPDPDLTEEDVKQKLQTAPNVFKAFMPIMLPIVLIVFKSISELPSLPFGEGPHTTIMGFIGQPVIALLIGVLLAFMLPKKLDKEMLSTTGWVGKGLLAAAIIILITGAGGAFGNVLRSSGIADVIGDALARANLGIFLPFLLAAAIKSAQGSSTVALITAASILAPLMAPLGFTTDVQVALVVLSIGAGSLVVSHANDSFFWIFTQFTNMDVKTGYRIWTTATLVLGVFMVFSIWVVYAIAA
jgi:GntP family gluconate:H+ symporter